MWTPEGTLLALLAKDFCHPRKATCWVPTGGGASDRMKMVQLVPLVMGEARAGNVPPTPDGKPRSRPAVTQGFRPPSPGRPLPGPARPVTGTGVPFIFEQHVGSQDPLLSIPGDQSCILHGPEARRPLGPQGSGEDMGPSLRV